MPTIVIAPDSFKESLDATNVAQAIATGWRSICPEDTLIIHPMADGGEGTMDAILSVLQGETREAHVTDPLGRNIKAFWGWLPDSGTAIIEMAQASGLHLLTPEERCPMKAYTYGTGELIKAALDAGAQTIILTLGGSATNDGGSGMLKALGLQLLDSNGAPLPPGGAALQNLARIDISQLDTRLKQVCFIAACDVDNPLCGPRGASAIFGPQKGATPDMVQHLDKALAHYAQICVNTLHTDHCNTCGAGAAGGTGFAALTFLNASFRPGVELVAELTGLAQTLRHAHLVITGEGKLDAQTLHGKTPMGVMKLAGPLNIPVITLAGTLGEGYQQLYAHGLTAAFSITPGPISLQHSQAQIRELLAHRAADIARLWTISYRKTKK